MILTRLSATNFRRFRELELGDLPRPGLIAIVLLLFGLVWEAK